MIPWEHFTEEMMHTLESGKRPKPSLRKEMVRIVVSAMMKQGSAGKRRATEVGKKMVAKYPQSLQDVISGDVIGPGYNSLVKQIKNRIDNVKRSSTPKIRKRKAESNDTEEISPEKRAAIQDTYGCIQWQEKFPPRGETQESQHAKKEKMKTMSPRNANPEEVRRLMKSTFYTQRIEVNQGENIKGLQKEWPLWFTEIGMAVHFKELTGISLQETFTRNVDMKGKRLLHYMDTVRNNKFRQALLKVKVMRGELEGCSEDIKEMVLLLLAYFDEKEDTMFCYVEDTCLAEEVQMGQVPVTPTIVICGKFTFTFT